MVVAAAPAFLLLVLGVEIFALRTERGVVAGVFFDGAGSGRTTGSIASEAGKSAVDDTPA